MNIIQEIQKIIIKAYQSNLEKALSGKKAGDIVEVNAPGDNYTIEIIEIMD